MLTIAAFGNPLLDTVVSIENTELLNKYNLDEDGQKEVDDTLMKSIFKDLIGYAKTVSAGGCAQNSLRILQWLLNKTINAYIFGAVGDDENALTLKKVVESDGVKTRYSALPNVPTGTTLAFIYGSNRSLVAHVGAAEQYTLNDLMSIQDLQEIVLNSSYIYIEGFFLTKRKEVANYVLDVCKKENKPFIFNLSGQYLVETESQLVEFFADNSDILFGNKREFVSLSKVKKLDTVDSLINKLLASHKGSNTIGKLIVITDGPNDIFCYHNNVIDKISVPKLVDTDYIDTTGAGDAFVSGFIAGLILQKHPKDCAALGCFASSHIIKQVGCSLPKCIPNIEEAFNYR